MIWKSRKKNRRRVRNDSFKRRPLRSETLEPRRLLAADAVHVGVVYLETDYLESDQDVGGDSQGDRFILSFTGGAPNTELSELRIRTDKDNDGISVGDPMFDTESDGLGKSGSHGFQVVRVTTSDGRSVDATAEVEDGGQELVLKLKNFRAGDRLEFTVDVDEVLRNASDPEVFNDRLDVITSGQEFQDSIMEAKFEAAHYEVVYADALFINNFGNLSESHGLALPADEGSNTDSRPNRSAAAVAVATQTPKPIEISGHVWIDNDLNELREPSESGLSGVEISLWSQTVSGNYLDTGHRTVTDTSGEFRFDRSLGLPPGTYRLAQMQPEGFFSVGAVAGNMDGLANGLAESNNVITGIHLPLGDTASVDQDFAEAVPASLGGSVYVDRNNDGIRDAGETGIPGVAIRLVPTGTIASQSILNTVTDAQGFYRFDGLAPGTYEAIEVSQPVGFADGIDSVGLVDGFINGLPDNMGDRIHSISLQGATAGTEYNFAELPYGSFSGFVFVAPPGFDCGVIPQSEESDALSDVEVALLDSSGQTIARTLTDADGFYRFDEVPVGAYAIGATASSGFISGMPQVGTLDGTRAGSLADSAQIQGILMTPGGVGENYNFCKGRPAIIGGTVYHDASNNGLLEPGEDAIPNVQVSLIDAAGNTVAMDVTDANGRYEFQQVDPGRYSIHEQQPQGYLDGKDRAGTIRGIQSGRGDGIDSIQAVELKQGDIGVDFNFAELLPASIEGTVYVDHDGDCEHDSLEHESIERGIAGVVIDLRGESGELITTTQTDDTGHYHFEALPPGNYRVVQHQPPGYLQEDRVISEMYSRFAGTDVYNATLASGENLVDVDFCELEPASISGRVWKESYARGGTSPIEIPLGDVMLELIDADGTTIEQTRTDSFGAYQFESLRPGIYSVLQVQPDDLFQGDQFAGSAGGETSAQDLITGIELSGGTRASGYDFFEVPPTQISGFVFQDGDALVLPQAPAAEELRRYQDGLLDETDHYLEGVLLELRDAEGAPVNGDAALPGTYAAGPIRVVTNASGFYSFSGLKPGNYHIFQNQPEGFVDGLDTPGSTGGVAMNRSDYSYMETLSLLKTLMQGTSAVPSNDAILNVQVLSDQHSTDNNFSELAMAPPTPPLYPPPRSVAVAGMTVAPADTEVIESPIRTASYRMDVAMRSSLDAYRMLWDPTGEWAVSWHLSVINGGYPRGVIVDSGNVYSVSLKLDRPTWNEGAHSKGRWTFGSEGRAENPLQVITLGEVRATALSGDFDGDGVDEAVIYVAGQWYVDLNGNGSWDAGDLWIRLGTELDRPVIGDWDGDGKDDVAIFGRQWQRDLMRIVRDPGLPDPANLRRRQVDLREAATMRESGRENPPRLLRRGNEGVLRADAVDHVFQYGEQADTPVAGDWNGDGIDQVGVFRGGYWMLDADGDGRWNDRDRRVEFGKPGDIPIVGDFNGDGIDEIGVVRGDTWFIDTDGDQRLTANDLQIRVPRDRNHGDPTSSQPIVGDFDGDGKDEPGYYNEAS